MGRVVRGEDKWLFGSQRPERGLSQGALMGQGLGECEPGPGLGRDVDGWE